MSALFAVLVSASAFFAAHALFTQKSPPPAPVQRGRWSPKTRPSFRARLRRA
jgi:hypothetical protein